jgi:alkylation response protein AidB-like acyl-CoA dehydrogenase
VDFQLNDEQLQLKKSVREFAEREIAPHIMKWDEAGEFPLATVKELGKLGLLGIVFPPEYGGAGMGYVEYVTAIEELSRVDGSPGTKPKRRSMSARWPQARLSARGA